MDSEDQVEAPDYAGLAIFSTFAPILFVVGSIVGSIFLAGNPSAVVLFRFGAFGLLAAGLVCGLRALRAAKLAGDSKYLVRGAVGVFANGLLLSFIGVSLVSGYMAGANGSGLSP